MWPHQRSLLTFILFLAVVLSATNSRVAIGQLVRSSAPRTGQATHSATTLEKCRQALHLSLLAARNGMHDLSLKAVQKALGGGPPIDPIVIQAGAISTSSLPNADAASRERLNGIRQQLLELGGLWRQTKADPVKVYRTIANVVFPDARPGEVFLYEGVASANSKATTDSLSAMLIRWAGYANSRKDLVQRLESRRNQPRAMWPVDVMLADIALNDGDFAIAAESLERIRKRLDGVSLQTWSELALHVAIPGLQHKETVVPSLAIVERAAENFSKKDFARSSTLLMMCARASLQRGADDIADRLLQRYLEVRQADHNRYSGSSGISRQQKERALVGSIYATHGNLEQSLKLFGEYCNVSVGQAGNVNLSSDMGLSLVRMLQRVPAEERYERLFDWSMPQAGVNVVRILATPVTEDRPPAVFAKALKDSPEGDPFAVALPGAAPTVADTASLLVEAAHEIGKLNELRISLRQLVATEPPPENAQLLLLRADLEAGDDEAIVAGLDAILTKLTKAKSGAVPLWPYFAVTRIAAGHTGAKEILASVNKRLVVMSKSPSNSLLIGYIHRDEAATRAMAGGVDFRASLNSPGLTNWNAASHRTASKLAAGATRPIWFSVDGHVNRRSGTYHENLFYRYPLIGNFDVTFNVWSGSYAEGHVSFGGLVIEAWPWNRRGSVYALGSHGTRQTKVPFANNGRFNQFRISVDGDTARTYINGYLIHTDTGGWSACPWAAFNCSEEQNAAFRNVRISGSPTIPREVQLVKANGLRGWIGDFYGESIPDQIKEPPATPNSDWHATDGVITGRKAKPTVSAQQSRLYYGRPLSSGESVQYEFFYKPGETAVHPALDRLAFLLEPDGVRLHWMTTGRDDWTALPVDNAIEEPANRRGPQKLQLKADAWNTVKIELRQTEGGTGDQLQINLNEKTIYERPIESDNQRLFGFFRYSDQVNSRIRNVVLTGSNWPEEFSDELAANVMRLIPPKESRVHDYRMRQAAIGEKFFATASWDVWLWGRDLPPEERYTYLAEWVLPSASHQTVRLYSDFIPSSLSPPAMERLKVTRKDEGTLASPAVMLAETAKELGRIDELYQSVEDLNFASGKLNQYAQEAFLGIINLVRGNNAEATKQIEGLFPYVKTIDRNDPEHHRWPALLATSEAVRHGVYTAPCEQMLRHIQLSKATFGDGYKHHMAHIRARIQVAIEDDLKGSDFGKPISLRHWQPVVNSMAKREAGGLPYPHWQMQGGRIHHFAGHDHDLLYFNTPIRGNFELNADVSGWREIQVAYASKLMFLDWNRTGINESNMARSQKFTKFEPPMKIKGSDFHYRLVVKDKRYQVFVNDRMVFEKKIEGEADPWLALHQPYSFRGQLRNLQITGDIKVPDEIRISDNAGLTGWYTDYFSENTGTHGVTWRREQNELRCRKGEIADSGRQSLLRYHRPMLEDGEIEYEFFYRPETILVHPALGRLTFLIQPDGVKTHWITDGMYDRSGVAHSNVVDEPKHRIGDDPLPLKPDAWNRAVLSLVGNTATLLLNDTPVFRRELNEGNPKTFGLFHFADKTETRVRNIVHRGKWPKQFPEESVGLFSQKEDPK